MTHETITTFPVFHVLITTYEQADELYLLCVNIDTGKPASESWMRMVPSYNHFGSKSPK